MRVELEGAGHDIAQPAIPVSATLHHKVQVVRPDPGVGVVLPFLGSVSKVEMD